MFRLSNTPKLDVCDVHAEARKQPRRWRHQPLLEAVAGATKPADRRGGILFVGGVQASDLLVRSAQAPLRLDRTPSRWSHAAVILEWLDGARPDQILGVECSLDPQADAPQVPERNGVTLFRLSRYMNAQRHPNLGFATVRLGKVVKGKKDAGVLVSAETKDRLVARALRPSDDRARFPLWQWIGAWQAFAHGSGDDPLARGAAHPGAAFCQYAYEGIGFDLTPGATTPDTCPETLWSTMLYWYDRFAEGGGGVGAWTSLTAPDSFERVTYSPDLGADLRAMQG